ncbi:Transmembrane protein [Toxocara canis]|uniref:Transmembrane protein 138 n=1 Tax=Toxocara canis TaxID=6265 RepID=A0A0B2VN96_TOXCA|nr:Transmembrane protein [Toxocara canis]
MANKYGAVLALQMSMLLLDVSFNATATLFTYDNTVQLMIFILQDAMIIMTVIVMVISFSSTFVFQAGLISLLLTKFASTIVLSIIYLFLSMLLHFFTLRQRWYNTEGTIWTYPFIAIFITQRLSSVSYYFAYKRTALLLSNPKYQHDSSWIREKIRQKS